MAKLRTMSVFAAPLLLLLLVIGGCSPAYYRYSGCHVDCKYCPPSPLPYVHYDGCACHSCAASKYLKRNASDTPARRNQADSFEPE